MSNDNGIDAKAVGGREARLNWFTSGSEGERLSLQRAWETVRECIRNENDLIHHRVFVLFTFEGFVFLAYGTLAKAAFDAWKEPLVSGLCFLLAITLCLIGFVPPFYYHPTLRAAYRQIGAVNMWWKKYCLNDPVPGFGDGTVGYRAACPFPTPIGKKAARENPLHWLLPVVAFLNRRKRKKLYEVPNEESYEEELRLTHAENIIIADVRKSNISDVVLGLAVVWGVLFYLTLAVGLFVVFFTSKVQAIPPAAA